MTKEEFITEQIKGSIAEQWDRDSDGYRIVELSLVDAYNIHLQFIDLQGRMDETYT